MSTHPTQTRPLFMAVTLFVALALGACGSTTAERAVSGGGIGAAAGAAGAALTGGNIGGGALLGGAAGAAIGGLTDEEDIDLGDFDW